MKRIRKRYRKAGNSGFNRLLALMLALAVCLSVTGVAVAANSIGSSPKALAVMPNGETVEISPNSVKPNAYIDAKWLDFVCQTALEDEDSSYNSDLNDAGKAALIAEYGKYTHNEAKIPSGHLEGTAPEEVNQNGEYHAFINAEVGGVQIHSIGILEIDGTEYVYYTTNSTQPTCAVYNVLRPDDKGMPANEQEKITLNYEHMQGQLIKYSTQMKGGGDLPEGGDPDSVFGAHPTLTTAADGTVSFPVTIPRGYKAVVKAYFVEGKEGDGTTMIFPEDGSDLDDWTHEPVKINSDMIAKPSNEGHSEIILGAMQSYEWEESDSNSWDYKSQMEGNATSSLTSTITVVEHKHNGDPDAHAPGKTRLYVVVSLEKTGNYTFSAVDWLGGDTNRGEVTNTGKIRWDFGKKADNRVQGNNSQLNTEVVNEKGQTQITDGAAEWSIRAVTTFTSGEDGNVQGALNDGYTAWSLTLLEINNEHVNVPTLPEFSNGDYPLIGDPQKNGYSFTTDKLGANERFKDYYDKNTNTVSNTAETILSTGTKITIDVVGRLLKAQDNVVDRETAGEIDDYAYFRTYTIKIENCKENLTVTAMNFSKDNSKEVILSPQSGVTDVQVWKHTPWAQPDTKVPAEWQNVNGVNGRLIDRSNANNIYDWYTDPIRFQRQVGYMPPNITIKNSAGETLWTAEDGSTSKWTDLSDVKDNITEEIGKSEDITEYKSRRDYWQMDTGGNIKFNYWQYYQAGELLIPTNPQGMSAPQTTTVWYNTPPSDAILVYDNEGFRWRRSGNHDYFGVVTDANWKERTISDSFVDAYQEALAGRYYKTSKNWTYSEWIDLNKADRDDGYYYFRTNKALDRYMYTEQPTSGGEKDIAYDNNRGKIYIEIDAEPIKVNVEYQDGTDINNVHPEDSGDVSNMPAADNSGYNVENKRTVLISPLIPQAEGYAFQHWELWVENAQITDEVGNPITFDSSQSVSINSVLESALQGKFDLTKGDTVTVTLKAVWKESTEKTAVNYDVNFWIPAETAADVQDVSVDDLESTNLSGDKKWYSIREDIHQVVDGGFVVADLYADGSSGQLSEHVMNTLKGNFRDSPGTDYTQNGSLQYVIATGEGLTPDPATWEVETADLPPGTNFPVDIFLKVDDTVNVTVTKTWQGSGGNGDAVLEKPDEIYVQLQRTTDTEISEDTVWSSEGITNAEWKLTPAQEGGIAPGWTHTWEKLPGKDDSGNVYTYRVVELTDSTANGGTVIKADGTLTTDDVDYTVSYGSGTAVPDPSDGKVLNAGITNQEKAADLVISKQVTGKFGDVTKPFDFTVTLKDNNGDVFDNYDNISAEKVEVENGVAQSPEEATLSFDGNGQATFTLKHNESLTIKSLPAGTQYTVEENVEKAEYTTKYVTKVGGGDAGEPGDGPAGGTMSGKDVAVEVTNNKVDIALTGLRDTTSSGLLMTMAAVLLGTAIVSVSLIKRRVKGNWK